MNKRDPKLVALEFNECINTRDLKGLERLMTDDHTFIDRDGKACQSRAVMIANWKRLFERFPAYKNTFKRVESTDNLVVMLGHAYWSEEQAYDPAIWTAVIIDDLVHEWHVYNDTGENRRRFILA